jgi:hypothetical protein
VFLLLDCYRFFRFRKQSRIRSRLLFTTCLPDNVPVVSLKGVPVRYFLCIFRYKNCILLKFQKFLSMDSWSALGDSLSPSTLTTVNRWDIASVVRPLIEVADWPLPHRRPGSSDSQAVEARLTNPLKHHRSVSTVEVKAAKEKENTFTQGLAINQ